MRCCSCHAAVVFCAWWQRASAQPHLHLFASLQPLLPSPQRTRRKNINSTGMTLLLSSGDGMVLNATLAAPLQQPGNRALAGLVFTVNGEKLVSGAC